MVGQKRRIDKMRNHERKRKNVSLYLPPVDVALKIYRVEAVDVRNNTFATVFTVLLDWEDPSV